MRDVLQPVPAGAAMSPVVQFAKLTFDQLLADGKVNESERETFYLGVATGIGWANETLRSHRHRQQGNVNDR